MDLCHARNSAAGDEIMSENCSHCWITSRNACSNYTGQALVEELASCGNLDRHSQLRNAASAEGYSGPYSTLLKNYENAEEEADLIKRMYIMLNDIYCETSVDRSEMYNIILEYEKWEADKIYR
jgi:hypothetical protein